VATVPSIRISKTSAYKGGSRVWSNRYFFTGGTPADNAHWLTLANAVTAAEKSCYPSGHVITLAEGYAAGSDVPVFTQVYNIPGTYVTGGNDRNTPLGVAMLVRWSTAARSVKNHPIYLFSYIRGGQYDNSVAGYDKLSLGQKANVAAYATSWISGFSDGAITAKRASPSAHVATGQVVEEYLTHRDFPYQSSV
jgi:hypothetical protein